MKWSNGHIYQRRRIYWIDIYIDGERHQRSLETSHKNIAYQKFQEIKHSLASGVNPFLAQDHAFSQVVKQYQALSRTTKAPSTVKREKRILEVLAGHFRDTPVAGISQADIEEYIQARSVAVRPPKKEDGEVGETIKAATINRELAVLRHILNKCVSWGYLEKNPCREVQKLRVQEKPIPYLSNDEIAGILAAADDWWKDIIRVLLETGVRASELSGLRWKDCDFERRQVTVQLTKSYRVRYLAMSGRLVEALTRLKAGSGPDDDRVFPHGTFWLIHKIRKICALAGLKGVSCHTFRHTVASRMASGGVPLMQIKEWMGHRSIATTQRYMHLAPNAQVRVDEVLRYDT